ncbi:mitochondrial carrier domain-containing protein [Rhodotorula diobovata]|uniref:Mitochondrial carrier domain-containing protein n=1 Tax=Rhodotorula diobovata TaxID=5288 RepID=A0A5C5FM85_9BASI|nr:mitochondrial carrier domain-containing protein [Rhodotorula diobovata]
MGLLLENALSEELPDHPRPAPSCSPPPRRRSDSDPRASPPPPASTRPSPATATDTDKMLAASIGAVLTSLTMTPFDVVKTRLQTQAPAQPHPTLTAARSSLAAPSTSPWPPPIPSTSSAPPPPPPPPHHPTLPPECCNNTTTTRATTHFFHANRPAATLRATPAAATATETLLCRFDPRIARAALPAAGAHHHHLAVAGVEGGAALCFYPSAIPVAGPGAAAAATTAPLSFSAPSASLSQPLAIQHAQHPPHGQHPRHLTGFLDALSHILRAEGPAALWRGTAPALAMSVPGQVGYMVGYDALRRTALRRFGDSDAAGVVVPLVAGSASRAAVAAALSPFELVRTRLQAQTRHSRVSLSQLVRQLRWSTAWRGLSSTLWRDVPFSGVYWAGYEGIKRALTGGRGMGEQRAAAAAGAPGPGAGLRDEGGRGARGEFATAFVSGAGSGVIAATLTNPFDVVKTRRQAPSTTGNGAVAEEARTLALLRHVVRTEGWRALWSGLTPRLAKVGPACGLMIGCYEAISGWRGAKRAATSESEGDRRELAME